MCFIESQGVDKEPVPLTAGLLQEPAYRMPYIHGKEKRAEYRQQVSAGGSGCHYYV